MNARPLQALLTAQPASDGAGVKLHRIVGPNGMLGLDPFLLLDEFASDSAADYIAGFPPHPHRGFETVTYMLDGEMLHEDHLGNRGRLSAGGVQPSGAKVLSKPFHLKDLVDEVEKLLAA